MAKARTRPTGRKVTTKARRKRAKPAARKGPSKAAIRKATKKGKPPLQRGKTFPAEVLTGDEVSRLIAGCSPRCPTGLRNRALICALYRAGLRLGEALSLKPKDCNESEGTLTVLRGKGGKRRVAGMDSAGWVHLTKWLAERQRLGLTGRQPVFCTLKGAALKTSYVRTLLKRLSAKQGVEKRCNPHSLRHSHAAELVREGVPMNAISKQLGHSNVGTTSVYVSHLTGNESASYVTNRNNGWEEPSKPTAELAAEIKAAREVLEKLLKQAGRS